MLSSSDTDCTFCDMAMQVKSSPLGRGLAGCTMGLGGGSKPDKPDESFGGSVLFGFQFVEN